VGVLGLTFTIQMELLSRTCRNIRDECDSLPVAFRVDKDTEKTISAETERVCCLSENSLIRQGCNWFGAVNEKIPCVNTVSFDCSGQSRRWRRRLAHSTETRSAERVQRFVPVRPDFLDGSRHATLDWVALPQPVNQHQSD